LGYPNGHFSSGILSGRRSRDLPNLLSKQAIFLQDGYGVFFFISQELAAVIGRCKILAEEKW